MNSRIRSACLLLVCVTAARTSAAEEMDRFASVGTWIETYPGHVAHVVAPLGNVKATAIGVAGVTAVVLLAHTQDDAVDDWVTRGHTLGSTADFASNTLPVLMAAGYAIPGALVPALRGREHLALSRTEALVEAVTAQALIVEGIKHIVKRQRPNGARFSSPSGHATYAFTVAGLTDATFGHRAGIPAYLAATLVGASRISLRRHWLSDVVAGAALGTTIGELVGRGHTEGEGSGLAAGWSPDRGITLEARVSLGR